MLPTSYPLSIPLENATTIIDNHIAKARLAGDPALNAYLRGQRLRYIQTLAHFPKGGSDSFALEIGTMEVFNRLLVSELNYARVDCTVWQPSNKQMRWHWNGSEYFNVNPERDTLPCEDQSYDFVLCAEILEHMSVDPMFVLSELNRVLKFGGRVFVTTPNITSTRAVWRILHGEAPYLFHQYLVPISNGRHNLEYSPALLAELMNAAGFETEAFWTTDTFDTPVKEIMDLLRKEGLSTEMRGDNIFYIGRKASRVRTRYPRGIYFDTR